MLQYLSQAAATRQAVFGTRTFPLGTDEHVISLFTLAQSGNLGKEFGVNGKPGDIYTVPEGRKLTVYQMDFNCFTSGTTAPPNGTIILMDALPDGSAASDVAAFYPDYIQFGTVNFQSQDLLWAIYLEKNDIDRPFTAGRQPRARVSDVNLAGSLELYGIEGPA